MDKSGFLWQGTHTDLVWTKDSLDQYCSLLLRFPTIEQQLEESLQIGSRKVDYGTGLVSLKLGGVLLARKHRKNKKTKKPYYAWSHPISIICFRIKGNHQQLLVHLITDDVVLYTQTLSLFIDQVVMDSAGYYHGKPCNPNEDENSDQFRGQFINPLAIKIY